MTNPPIEMCVYPWLDRQEEFQYAVRVWISVPRALYLAFDREILRFTAFDPPHAALLLEQSLAFNAIGDVVCVCYRWRCRAAHWAWWIVRRMRSYAGVRVMKSWIHFISDGGQWLVAREVAVISELQRKTPPEAKGEKFADWMNRLGVTYDAAERNRQAEAATCVDKRQGGEACAL